MLNRAYRRGLRFRRMLAGFDSVLVSVLLSEDLVSAGLDSVLDLDQIPGRAPSLNSDSFFEEEDDPLLA